MSRPTANDKTFSGSRSFAGLALAKRGVKRTIKKSAPLWNAVVRLREMAAAMRKAEPEKLDEP